MTGMALGTMRSLSESGEAKIAAFVQDVTSLEDVSEVERAMDSGRWPDALITKLKLCDADFVVPATSSSETASVESNLGAVPTHQVTLDELISLPLCTKLNASGAAKLLQLVEECATVAEIEAIQTERKNGRISESLAKRAGLNHGDFEASQGSSVCSSVRRGRPVTQILGELKSLSWNSFVQQVDRRCELLIELRGKLASVVDETSPRTRLDVQLSMFLALDADIDSRLSENETLTFARLAGYDGSDNEWRAEFATVCAELSADASFGLDMDAFVSMTDGVGASGCRCSTSELLRIAGSIAWDVSASMMKAQQERCRSRTPPRQGIAAASVERQSTIASKSSKCGAEGGRVQHGIRRGSVGGA